MTIIYKGCVIQGTVDEIREFLQKEEQLTFQSLFGSGLPTNNEELGKEIKL